MKSKKVKKIKEIQLKNTEENQTVETYDKICSTEG